MHSCVHLERVANYVSEQNVAGKSEINFLDTSNKPILFHKSHGFRGVKTKRIFMMLCHLTTR